MKQTKFTEEAHACNDMKGRMVSEYKRAGEAYKADVAAGKVPAPVMPTHEKVPDEKPPITSTHNERKETEQARLS